MSSPSKSGFWIRFSPTPKYLKPQYEEFWDVRSSLKKRGIKIAPESDESFEKKSKNESMYNLLQCIS
ncbi:hypothetical protein PVAND_012659 [Polypedilum vanderplanki]|uniref:Uncharacterized protein n=1 Tax=Polypedilum vanderplanki TaxID=319348 RepID=A0A9J6CP37_POLVA|nr:hypothetical protein PVAND_012659 [Polypedilum vanderplanki]